MLTRLFFCLFILNLAAEAAPVHDLFYGAQSGSVKKIGRALFRQANIYATWGHHEWNALHYAAANGHEAAAYLLNSAGININSLTNKNQTPLHLAAKYNRVDLLLSLWLLGADLLIKDKAGNTALQVAIISNNMEAAFILSELDMMEIKEPKQKSSKQMTSKKSSYAGNRYEPLFNL